MITIVIPARNEERFIRKTVESALGQADYVIVFDNCSDDATISSIVDLELVHSNLRIVRRKENIGAQRNFNEALLEVETDYVMWLGAHDIIPPDYVKRLVAELDKNPTFGLAYGSVLYINALDTEFSRYHYEYSAALESPDPYFRLKTLFRNLHDCGGLIQGVFRTALLKSSLKNIPVIGADHIILANVLAKAPFKYSREVLYHRREFRPHDGIEGYVSRMAPGKKIQLARPFQDVQNAELRIIRELGYSSVFSKIIAVETIRFWLIERFGIFFSDNLADNALNIFYFPFSFVFRKIKKFF